MVKIGQAEIMDELKAHPGEWYNAKQLSSIMGFSIGSVSRCISHIINDCSDIIKTKTVKSYASGRKTRLITYMGE